MTQEELKAFELAHPEYKDLFRPMMAGFDAIAREEFGKAFKAIDERLLAVRKEHVEKYHMPEEDAKFLCEAWMAFMNQFDKDLKNNIKLYFEKNKK